MIHSQTDLRNAKRAYAKAGYTYQGQRLMRDGRAVHTWTKPGQERLAGAGEQWGERLDAKRILIAAGIGAGVSAIVAYGVKRKLEQDFGAGAEEIRAELTDRGSVLRAEIEREAAEAGREAAIGALNDWGITPALIRDIGVLADAAARLTTMASGAGMTIESMLSQIRARAEAIRRGVVTGFA